MRITMKGGVWKNSEDEVLKAAVMKYGLQNWSRVASLLVRKSAKQCKARWYNWLDPSVKKTEWTTEEEEKLLTLVRLYPTQWRTISTLVGRTAYQCLEHYEKLLDEAQGKDPTVQDPTDPRHLRPGEIDPHPESKPSRADAIDLADDEKEMLSEARARLANARGKKAKRKAREKQLEEARRMASLQKRREMRAAGLSVGKMRGKKNEIDYGREIPFEQQPQIGSHPVGPEETPVSDLSRANINLQELEGKRRVEEERRMRADDARRLKRLMAEDLPEALRKIQEANDEPLAFRKKQKIALPTPQMTEDEIETLFRYEAKKHGVVDLKSTASASVIQSSTSSREKQKFRFDEETGEYTPNPVASATPTPALSMIKAASLSGETPSIASSTDQGFRAKESLVSLQAKTSLLELPKPQNIVEKQLPTFTDLRSSASSSVADEDMEVIDKDDEEKEMRKRMKEDERSAIKQKLPRPFFVELGKFEADGVFVFPGEELTKDELVEAQTLLQKELKHLYFNDAIRRPISSVVKLPEDPGPLERIHVNDLGEATALLELEVQEMREAEKRKSTSKDGEVEEENLTLEDCKMWDEKISNLKYLPTKKEYVDTKECILGVRERFDVARKMVDDLKDVYQRELKKVGKQKNKYEVRTKGYQDLNSAILKKIENLWKEFKTAEREKEVLSVAEEKEREFIKRRIEELEDYLLTKRQHHSTFQTRFENLTKERNSKVLLLSQNS